jgi:hypothetical protein
MMAPRPKLLVREGGVCAAISWDSVGYFLDRVETPSQCATVVDLINQANGVENWARLRITGPKLRNVLRCIDEKGQHLPLKVARRDFDDAGLSGEPFREDGCWLVGYAIVELGSIVQYKYAISATNRVALLGRVVVQGPPPELAPVGPVTLRGEARCESFLQVAAHLSDWRKELSEAKDARLRLALVRDIGRYIARGAAEAIPDVAGAIEDPDSQVREAAVHALGGIGRPAVPALRRALGSRWSGVRYKAAHELRWMGAAAKDALPKLRMACSDPDAKVGGMAAAAFEAISRAQPPAAKPSAAGP